MDSNVNMNNLINGGANNNNNGQAIGINVTNNQPMQAVTNNQNNLKELDFVNTPVVDVVNGIINEAVTMGASDIHFDPAEDGLRVRIRIDGILDDYAMIPSSVRQNVVTRIKILSGMNITETRLPQDGAIKMVLNNRDLDMRVSSLPTKRGEKYAWY